jgi:8-oxo-dGTP pyrophosphatase MutT (NUDIX family)
MRKVVRAVVLDARERILLFHTRDPTVPERGEWWELPGGGLEPGETYLEAVIRELAEEAGLAITPAQVGPPNWRRQASFVYRNVRLDNDEVVVTVRLDGDGPDVDGTNRVDFEDEDYFGFRWWPVGEVVASRELFYPGRLPAMLTPFLAGEEIDEPFENWS